MKKCILFAGFIFALSGDSAAQTTPVKTSKVQEQKTQKKGAEVKSNTNSKSTPKTETKSQETKLPIPVPPASDTITSVPKVKNFLLPRR